MGMSGLSVSPALKTAAGPGNRRRAVGPNRLLAVAQIALPLVLLLTALFASYLPARRASPVNPAVALRAD